MMNSDRIRQINELFYNSVNHKNMSELDMTTLKAMKAELDRLIRYREDEDFKERTRTTCFQQRLSRCFYQIRG